MREELSRFLGCEDETKLISELKKRLSRKNQIEYYDTIFANYLETNPDLSNIFNIIPGYSYLIKLLIFSVYFREELFIEKVQDETLLNNSEQCKEFLRLSLSHHNVINDTFNEISYSVMVHNIVESTCVEEQEFIFYSENGAEIHDSFLTDYAYLLKEPNKMGFRPTSSSSNFFYPYEFSVEKYNKRLPRRPIICKPYFKYILFGNAVITKFEDICDGLFLNSHIKLFAGCYLYKQKNGPHNNTFTNPGSFLTHDFDHISGVVQNFERSGNEQSIDKMELYSFFENRRASFEFRYVCMILFWNIFEGLIVGEIDKFLLKPLDFQNYEVDFYGRDIHYCIKWILNSPMVSRELLEKVKVYLKDLHKMVRCDSKMKTKQIENILSEKGERLEKLEKYCNGILDDYDMEDGETFTFEIVLYHLSKEFERILNR